MTRHLDPDRSPPPRFWPFPIDIDTNVCDRCSAMVPATDKAQTQHTDHHRQVDALAAGFATAALASQLSDPGSRTATPAGATADASPGSASTSGSGSRPTLPGTTAPIGATSPDPDSNVPTPEQEATAGRSGVADTHQGTDAADLLPGSVTPPAAVFPPAAAGTKRAGRGSGDPGEHHGSAPAGTFHGDAPNLPLSDESVDLWTP